MNVPSLHAISPCDIGMQRSEHGLDVTSIEALVDLLRDSTSMYIGALHDSSVEILR